MLKSDHTLFATALLAVMLFLFTSCSTVNSYANYHMYPQCESTVYSAKIMGKGETTVYTFPEKMTELTFTCLTHVVNSSSGTGPNEPFSDICYGSRFDPFPYSFLLRITHTDSKGKVQNHHHNIKIADSGSTASLTYQVTEPSTYELVFVNNASVSNCELNIRIMFTYNSSNSYSATESTVEDKLSDGKTLSVPALVGLRPSLLHLFTSQTYLACTQAPFVIYIEYLLQKAIKATSNNVLILVLLSTILLILISYCLFYKLCMFIVIT